MVDTRVSDEGDIVRRRRKCAACDKRFTTYERAEIQLPQVVKKKSFVPAVGLYDVPKADKFITKGARTSYR